MSGFIKGDQIIQIMCDQFRAAFLRLKCFKHFIATNKSGRQPYRFEILRSQQGTLRSLRGTLSSPHGTISSPRCTLSGP